MNRKPTTDAYISIEQQSFTNKCIKGKVKAGGFEWQFIWSFNKDELYVSPPLGRALIKDALERFLVNTDYKLETGGEYILKIRAKF